MTTRRRVLGQIAGGAIGLGALGPKAFAQANVYPNRPIHISLGFAAGSGADLLVRYYAQKLEVLAKQPVIIDNKPGATGNIATRAVAKADPDGYNILATGNSGISAAPYLFKELPFDTMKDIKPVGSFAAIAFVLVISPKSPINNVQELIVKLKAKQDNIFGYTNPTGIFSAEMIKKITGIPAKPIAYKTTADAMKDIIDGTLDFMVMDGTFASGQVRQGQLKALGVTTRVPSPSFPGVPTLNEAGVPGFDFSPWWALYVPAATPQPIVDKLDGWLQEIGKMPETPKFLESVGSIGQSDNSKAALARLQAEIPMWPDLVKAAGIEPQ
jgi:tripartite-type tricarboxylate transporter receptor subunit TctC